MQCIANFLHLMFLEFMHCFFPPKNCMLLISSSGKGRQQQCCIHMYLQKACIFDHIEVRSIYLACGLRTPRRRNNASAISKFKLNRSFWITGGKMLALRRTRDLIYQIWNKTTTTDDSKLAKYRGTSARSNLREGYMVGKRLQIFIWHNHFAMWIGHAKLSDVGECNISKCISHCNNILTLFVFFPPL